MSVELITDYSEELHTSINNLVPQLSSSTPPLTEEQVRTFIEQDHVYLFAYRYEGEILGMLTLATFIIPTGLRAWIEDVVVDEKTRGQGAGQQLVEAALAHAEKLGCRTVDLTSRPSREAANRLYVRCGFEQRETNIYRAKK